MNLYFLRVKNFPLEIIRLKIANFWKRRKKIIATKGGQIPHYIAPHKLGLCLLGGYVQNGVKEHFA
jgi:hypothetical protein